MSKIELLQEQLNIINQQINLISIDYPVDVNNAFKYTNLVEERTKLIKDIKSCKSDDPDLMCSDCDCWKHTRQMCS